MVKIDIFCAVEPGLIVTCKRCKRGAKKVDASSETRYRTGFFIKNTIVAPAYEQYFNHFSKTPKF